MHESQLTIEEIKAFLEENGKIVVAPLCAHCAATLFYELARIYPDAFIKIYGKKTVYSLFVDLERAKNEGNDD